MRVCKVCEQGISTVRSIEKDYVDGQSKSGIARKYNVPLQSVDYHLQYHMPDKIAKAAGTELQKDGLYLLQRVDTLLSRMEAVYLRNDIKRDGLALKALDKQRGVFELLCKISDSMHKARLAELEVKKFEHQTTTNIDFSMLTDKEKQLYFQLNSKLLGNENITIDTSFTDYSPMPIRRKRVEVETEPEADFEEEDDTQELNESKLTRTRFPSKPKHAEDSSEELRFKPLEQSTPTRDRQVERTRRLLSGALKHADENQHPATPGSPFI